MRIVRPTIILVFLIFLLGAGPYEVDVELEGLNLFVSKGATKSGNKFTKAGEVRVILVNSNYEGNKNAHKMTHVPTIEFISGSIDLAKATPIFVTCECLDAVCSKCKEKWFGWYLHDTRVSFDTSGDVTLKGYEQICDLGEIHTNADLSQVDATVWNGRDPKRRVNSRVFLQGGTLSVTDEAEAILTTGTVKVATALTWEDEISKVILSRLVTGKNKIEIPITMKDAKIRIRNRPAMPPMDKKTAYHFYEYYDMSKGKAKKREAPQRAKPPTPISSVTADDSFCPPARQFAR